MREIPPWSAPPEELTLGSDEVHVWRATLDRSAADRERLEQTLSAEERARAGKFYFQRDREQFMVARGLLRMVLGRYLGLEPDQVRFCYAANGKPALSPEPCPSRIRFNLSHSHGLALYAVTRGHEVGIDLEYVRPDLAGEPIAERFFAAREVAALRGLPNSLQVEGFFNCWTRKEAYIKAGGEGLTVRLDQFEVTLAPGEPAALLNVNGDPAESSRWSLRELAPGPGYVAAVAVEAGDWQLRCWEWPLEKEK
jgi:4'-phosphopantetheinyl transferase